MSLETFGCAVFLFVHMLFVAFVEVVKLIGVYSSVKMDGVLVHRLGHERSIYVAILRKLVNVVLVKVRVSGAVITRLGLLWLFRLLLLLLSLLIECHFVGECTRLLRREMHVCKPFVACHCALKYFFECRR
jgi:hypothetical protein